VNRREYNEKAKYLDEIAPLQGASHSDVVDYSVTVPFFYAELRARLANGKLARLVDASQFIGWFGYGPNPTLLLDCGGQRVAVNTDASSTAAQDMFIARDGGQIPLHA